MFLCHDKHLSLDKKEKDLQKGFFFSTDRADISRIGCRFFRRRCLVHGAFVLLHLSHNSLRRKLKEVRGLHAGNLSFNTFSYFLS